MSMPAAGPFSRATALIVTLVGVFAFVCLVVVFAYAPDLRGGSDPDAHALSRSAVGYAGLVKLLRLQGGSVIVAREAQIEDVRERGMEILAPRQSAPAKEVRAALFANRNLIILPKWETAPDPAHMGWVRKVGPIPAEAYGAGYLHELVGEVQVQRARGASRTMLAARMGGPKAAEGDIGVVDSLQTISGPRLVPLLVDTGGRAVLVRTDLDHAAVFILADPDLVNTQGLADIRRAGFASRMFQSFLPGPFVFDVTLNGFKRQRSFLRLAFDPPFLAVTLCAAFAALLMGWRAAVRFGPPLVAGRAIALGKRALADNSAALIGLARREADMATPYAVQTRAAVAAAVGAPTDLDTTELNAFLQRLGERRQVKTGLMDLLERASAVRNGHDLVAVARDLHQWRLEMTREPS